MKTQKVQMVYFTDVPEDWYRTYKGALASAKRIASVHPKSPNGRSVPVFNGKWTKEKGTYATRRLATVRSVCRIDVKCAK